MIKMNIKSLDEQHQNQLFQLVASLAGNALTLKNNFYHGPYQSFIKSLSKVISMKKGRIQSNDESGHFS